jgi:predicted Zn finger-like uncharacterized protein
MIITCPNCGARYKVRDDLISEKGKRVKCKKCTAVFRVNKEGQSKLEKAPEKAPEQEAQQQFKVNVGAPKADLPPKPGPKPEAQPEEPKTPPISAGATVRVDRSQLEDFLKQHQPPAQPDDMPEPPSVFDEPTAKTPPVPPPADESAGSTVAMDRSELDSFLKEQQSSQVDEDAMPDTASTMAMDRGELDHFLQNQQSEGNPAGDHGFDINQDESDSASTMAMDRSELDQFLQNQQAEANTAANDGGFDVNQDESESAATMAMDRSELDQFLQNQGGQPAAGFDDDSESSTVQMDVGAFQDQLREESAPSEAKERVTSHDFEAEAKSGEPEFPSDEELGLDQEKEDLSSAPAEDESSFDFGDDTLDKQEPLANVPPPVANDPFATNPESQASDQQATSSELYVAKVEGTEYPNLDLEAIERWIREGRLLEEDELALQGSDEFKPASSYPSVAQYFEHFHGASQAAVTPPEPAKKKGFFAKLFGIFSKKK